MPRSQPMHRGCSCEGSVFRKRTQGKCAGTCVQLSLVEKTSNKRVACAIEALYSEAKCCEPGCFARSKDQGPTRVWESRMLTSLWSHLKGKWFKTTPSASFPGWEEGCLQKSTRASSVMSCRRMPAGIERKGAVPKASSPMLSFRTKTRLQNQGVLMRRLSRHKIKSCNPCFCTQPTLCLFVAPVLFAQKPHRLPHLYSSSSRMMSLEVVEALLQTLYVQSNQRIHKLQATPSASCTSWFKTCRVVSCCPNSPWMSTL